MEVKYLTELVCYHCGPGYAAAVREGCFCSQCTRSLGLTAKGFLSLESVSDRQRRDCLSDALLALGFLLGAGRNDDWILEEVARIKALL